MRLWALELACTLLWALPSLEHSSTASLQKGVAGSDGGSCVCQAARSEASTAAVSQMESAARSQEQLEGHLAVLRATAADCQVCLPPVHACILTRTSTFFTLCWLFGHVCELPECQAELLVSGADAG